MDEIGTYDVKAFIDLILDHTGYKKLNLMCISMGCSLHTVLVTARPEYNDKILGAFYFVPLINNINRQLDAPAALQIALTGLELAAVRITVFSFCSSFLKKN